MSARLELYVGASILTSEGPRLVEAVTPMGYMTRSTTGDLKEINWRDLEPTRGISKGRVDAISSSFAVRWEGLSQAAKDEALDRLEAVLTILTGFANGHEALARPREPMWPFDPAHAQPMRTRVRAMSQYLAQEAELDRRRARASETGERSLGEGLGAVSERTLYQWCRTFQDPEGGGLPSLVDARRMRRYESFPTLDPVVMRVAQDQLQQLDGTRSVRSVDEVVRRTLIQLKAEGLSELEVPDRTLRAFIAHTRKKTGRTTRSQASHRLRGVSSYTSYPSLRPGQVVAIDVTRADNLVYDPWSQKVISVEIITALDVATRVVLAVRIVPRSADSMDAGLILYDVLRPFSMSVDAERVDDWRWAGVPESLGLIPDAVDEAERLSRSGLAVEAKHHIPGLVPDSVRVDHGSIFTSAQFRDVCRRFGIHLLLSRGKRPTDNAFVERWHETLQRGLQQVNGHKGRNVTQRGSEVGKIKIRDGKPVFNGDGPLLTARELERHLREFIAIDYHRSWHQGLNLVDSHVNQEEAQLRLAPIDSFDIMLQATGRLHVLQRPDLIYDLLPIRWGTIGHAGVEFNNMTYDSPELDEFRNVPTGFFREGDRAAPFFRDPHDVSRLWFRHPKTDSVVEVLWRKSHQLNAPMTDIMLRHAVSTVRRRGGNRRLNSSSVQREILEVLNDVGDLERLRNAPELADWKVGMVTAAHMRSARSKYDHAEARNSARVEDRRRRPETTRSTDTSGAEVATDGFDLMSEWPDYGEGSP